jgi:GTPase SAR1 family protein
MISPDLPPVLSLPDFDPSLTTYIRDSMALVQCMDAKKHRTFGDLATDYCRELTSCFAKAHTVADVFDRYDVKNSIKLAERERFFQSGIFLPSMTWNTFVWAVTLVRRSLSANLMDFFPSLFYVIPVKYICYCMCFCKA